MSSSSVSSAMGMSGVRFGGGESASGGKVSGSGDRGSGSVQGAVEKAVASGLVVQGDGPIIRDSGLTASGSGRGLDIVGPGATLMKGKGKAAGRGNTRKGKSTDESVDGEATVYKSVYTVSDDDVGHLGQRGP